MYIMKARVYVYPSMSLSSLCSLLLCVYRFRYLCCAKFFSLEQNQRHSRPCMIWMLPNHQIMSHHVLLSQHNSKFHRLLQTHRALLRSFKVLYQESGFITKKTGSILQVNLPFILKHVGQASPSLRFPWHTISPAERHLIISSST